MAPQVQLVTAGQDAINRADWKVAEEVFREALTVGESASLLKLVLPPECGGQPIERLCVFFLSVSRRAPTPADPRSGSPKWQ